MKVENEFYTNSVRDDIDYSNGTNKISSREYIIKQTVEHIKNADKLNEKFINTKKLIDNTLTSSLRLFASKKQIKDFENLKGIDGDLCSLKEKMLIQLKILSELSAKLEDRC